MRHAHASPPDPLLSSDEHVAVVDLWQRRTTARTPSPVGCRAAVKQASAQLGRTGNEPDHSLLPDGLREDRAQGATIGVTLLAVGAKMLRLV